MIVIMAGTIRCVYVAALLLCLGSMIMAISRNDSIRLMDDMLRGYNRKHRPVMNQSEPVKVNITFDMVSIRDFDEVDMVSIRDFDEVNGVLSVVALLQLRWHDKTIFWNPASYGGITSQVYSVEDVWYPLLVTASSAENLESLIDDWMTIRVFSSGLSAIDIGLLLPSTCELDVSYYPFDVQTCTISFTPWTESKLEVKLDSPIPHCSDRFYRQHGQWNIINNATFEAPILSYNLQLVLQRKPLFAVVTTILPIIFMSILNLLVFFIPVQSGERISYTMTVLLATAVFLTLVSETLPKTSEPMSAISFFLMINLICGILICIGTIWTIQIYLRDEIRKIPKWQCALVRCLQCRSRKDNHTGFCNRKKSEKHYAMNGERPPEVALDSLDINYNDERPVTWQDVSSVLDWCLLIVFSIIIIVDTLVFLTLLIYNH